MICNEFKKKKDYIKKSYILFWNSKKMWINIEVYVWLQDTRWTMFY